jgi:hypothetical protein
MNNSIISLIAQLDATCAEKGVRLMKAEGIDLSGSPHITLPRKEFIKLAETEQPPVIFYKTTAFYKDEFIADTLAEQGWRAKWDEGEAHISLRKDLKKLTHQEGLPWHAIITYWSQGQSRVCTETTDWADELYQKITGTVQDERDREEADEQKVEEELKNIIEQVARDPYFKAIRGRPKKLIYVQTKYGDIIPKHPRGQMNRPAQHCAYVDANLSSVVVKADEINLAEEYAK